MSDRVRIGLDNPVFSGRLRVTHGGAVLAKPNFVTANRHLPQKLAPKSTAYIKPLDINWPRMTDYSAPSYPKRLTERQLSRSDRAYMIGSGQIPRRHSEQPGQLFIQEQTAQAELPKNEQVIAEPEQSLYQQAAPQETVYFDARTNESKQRFSFNLNLDFLRSFNFRSLRQIPSLDLRKFSRAQLAIFGSAALIFTLGLVLSLQTWTTNKAASSQVAALTKQVNSIGSTDTSKQSASLPSTVKPTPTQLAAYVAPPNAPKYINIPKLDVHAMVLQVGLLSSGALGTPNNVYDAAWYNGSALPGQPGATLIDGHVSSWTSHGVFYGIHTLQPGDSIQIVLGNNTLVNYQVVKTQTYPASGVDMKAAVTPIDPTVSGLNLITCTGQVIKGTSTFNERVIIFAKEV